jgi:hypothetical protein
MYVFLHTGAPMRAVAWARVAAAVAVRPGLWPTAAVQAVRLAPPGWWRRWPPLPVPDPDWMRFRLRTAYGDADRDPEPEDVVAWLYWCRRTDRSRYPHRR